MYKLVTGSLLLTLAVFQFQIWFGESSIRSINELEAQLEAQLISNRELEDRNRLLEIEVQDLHNGTEALEERARSNLRMIGEDETFYLIVD